MLKKAIQTITWGDPQHDLFEYILLIFSTFNGFIFLGELPDFYSIIGMSLIVGSGLYIIFRENVKDKLIVSKTTLRT